MNDNFTGKYQNSKFVEHGYQLFKTKTDRTKRRNKEIYKHSGKYNIPLSIVTKAKNQKVYKKYEQQSKVNVTEIYRTLHPTMIEFLCFLSVHGTF